MLAESLYQQRHPAADMRGGVRLFNSTLPVGRTGHVLIVEADLSVFAFDPRSVSAIASVNNRMMNPPFMTQFGDRCDYSGLETCTVSALWTLDLDEVELEAPGTQFIGQPLEFYILLRDDEAPFSSGADRFISGSVVARLELTP